MSARAAGRKGRKLPPSGIAAALAQAQQQPSSQGGSKAFIDAARTARLMRQMSRDFI